MIAAMRIFTFIRALSLTRFSALLLCAAVVLPITPALAANDDRVALVIGNDQYPSDPLRNAVNDAQAVAKTLSDLGFKVMIKTNADYATMRGAAVEFAKVMEGATAAVFYYAGHGIQYRGQNFLVPTDAKLTSEASIAFNAMPVTQILDTMDDAKVRHKFIILDACRNNPFSSVFTSTGLAKIQAPAGTIVSFAAAAGQVAPDGAEGVNSLFTRIMIREMRDPQQQAAAMFQRVQTLVAQESMNKQLPEFHNTPLFRVPFFFAERSGHVATAPAQSLGLSGDAQAAIEGEFWRSAKEGRRIEGYQLYVEKYPNGSFSSLARLEIDRLRREMSQLQVAATPLSSGNAATAPVLVPESNTSRVASVPLSPATNTVERPPAPPLKTVIASAAPANVSHANDSRGIDIKSANTNAPSQRPLESAVPLSSASQSGSLVAAGADKLAAISPEQRTTLPAVPEAARVLSGLIQFPGGATYNANTGKPRTSCRFCMVRANSFRLRSGIKANFGITKSKVRAPTYGPMATDMKVISLKTNPPVGASSYLLPVTGTMANTPEVPLMAKESSSQRTATKRMAPSSTTKRVDRQSTYLPVATNMKAKWLPEKCPGRERSQPRVVTAGKLTL